MSVEDTADGTAFALCRTDVILIQFIEHCCPDIFRQYRDLRDRDCKRREYHEIEESTDALTETHIAPRREPVKDQAEYPHENNAEEKARKRNSKHC